MTSRTVLFLAVGAALGYAMHRIVGCRGGACMITSDPYLAMVYGAILGLLLSGCCG